MSAIPKTVIEALDRAFREAAGLPTDLRRYRYADLEDGGYGSRVTIWRRVREGRFPKPQLDESGLPYWTAAQLQSTNPEQ